MGFFWHNRDCIIEAERVASSKLLFISHRQAHSGASLRDCLQCVSHYLGSPSPLHLPCKQNWASLRNDETSEMCYCAKGSTSQACLSYAETKLALASAKHIVRSIEDDILLEAPRWRVAATWWTLTHRRCMVNVGAPSLHGERWRVTWWMLDHS